MSNYATFLRFGAMDWEKPAAGTQDSPEMLLRSRVGCAFCARSFWTEELDDVFLQGEQCFMQNPDAVWKLTGVDRYHERWPLIPLEDRCLKKNVGLFVLVFVGYTVIPQGFSSQMRQELQASAVDVGTKKKSLYVLLHKRRVPDAAIRGDATVRVCRDCYGCFSGKKPTLCKFALVNDLWLGRIDPLLWQANLTHEMFGVGQNGCDQSGFAFWAEPKPRIPKCESMGSCFSTIRIGWFSYSFSQW